MDDETPQKRYRNIAKNVHLELSIKIVKGDESILEIRV